MGTVTLLHHGLRVELPAPHPKRVVVRARDADGQPIEQHTLRFLDLFDDEAERLRQALDTIGEDVPFTLLDEDGREQAVRLAPEPQRAVRHGPGQWTVELVLSFLASPSAPSDDDGQPVPSGWIRWRRPGNDVPFVIDLPTPLPGWTESRTPLRAVGLAADGTRYVRETGRVRVLRRCAFAPLDTARRDRLADFHQRDARGGDPAFDEIDSAGVVVAWRFDDAPLTFTRLPSGAWRAECVCVRDIDTTPSFV